MAVTAWWTSRIISPCYTLSLQKLDQSKNGLLLPYLDWRCPVLTGLFWERAKTKHQETLAVLSPFPWHMFWRTTFLGPSALTFAIGTQQATYTRWNNSHSLRIQIVRGKFHLGSFFPISFCFTITTGQSQADFFRATEQAVLMYVSTAWTLTKALESKLDRTYTWMPRVVLNISWGQHQTKSQLYTPNPDIYTILREGRMHFSGSLLSSKTGNLAWCTTLET